MALHPQSLQNNMLSTLKAQAGAKVSGSIERASTKTGVDFAYLMQQANAESSFRTDVKAKTSSAKGLFQFIDKTWLSMIDRYGEQYGIDTNQSKSNLLALRSDPDISSYMAGELAKENKQIMTSLLGENTNIGSTELYFAHFMGPSRAAGFLEAHHDAPHMKGADLFPKEAQANRGVFFDTHQRPRTLAEIYDKFDAKFSVSPQETQPVTHIATKQTDTPQIIDSIRPTYSNTNPLAYLTKANPYVDFLAPSTTSNKQSSAFSNLTSQVKNEYGFNNFLQNPADLLWLTALEDDLSNNNNSINDKRRL